MSDSEYRPAAIQPAETIEIDPVRHTVRLPAGLTIDLGGVAKGWAADTAARWLRFAGPALVDAGGDIAISGPLPDGVPWPIGVLNPFDPGSDLATLAIHQGGVATSGRDVRRWTLDGVVKHHLIDPRTGEPAETGVLSVTVAGPSALEAEAAAKVVLLRGAEDGLNWLNGHPAFAALVVCENGDIRPSSDWQTRIWSN